MERITHYAILALIAAACSLTCPQAAAQQKPNIIFIMTDDQGYRDVGSYGYGSKKLVTPHLDAMAKTGRIFTNYYVAANVCTPSRAGILTGCYPQRINMEQVLFPQTGPAYIKGKNQHGLNPNEETIASLLRDNGYTTACTGKWHLGYQTGFLPLQHGFDEFLGIPYSHDMIPQTDSLYPPLPLIKGNKILRINFPLDSLTQTFTDFSVDFINRNKHRPFFLYLAYSMPHVPLAVSKKYDGITKKGLYADVIYEIDASVGRIMQTLEKNGLDRNTLVIFTSDNGPWLKFGNHAGMAYGLKEGKGTTYDGGHKVPFIAQWKGTVPANSTCNEPLSGTDILPTLISFAGANQPKLKIDGHNAGYLFTEKKPSPNNNPIYFFNATELQAVRQGSYKYHFAHGYDSVTVKGNNGKQGSSARQQQQEALYNIKNDPGEKINLINTRKKTALELKKTAESFINEIKINQRPNGRIK
ncbi:sulfatase family protein [Niabella aquatica]